MLRCLWLVKQSGKLILPSVSMDDAYHVVAILDDFGFRQLCEPSPIFTKNVDRVVAPDTLHNHEASVRKGISDIVGKPALADVLFGGFMRQDRLLAIHDDLLSVFRSAFEHCL